MKLSWNRSQFKNSTEQPLASGLVSLWSLRSTKFCRFESSQLDAVAKLAGRADIDLTTEPIQNGVFLRDLWPSLDEIKQAMLSALQPEVFRTLYKDFAAQNPARYAIRPQIGLFVNRLQHLQHRVRRLGRNHLALYLRCELLHPVRSEAGIDVDREVLGLPLQVAGRDQPARISRHRRPRDRKRPAENTRHVLSRYAETRA